MSAFSIALTPIAVLILLGYILKRSHFLPEETWPGMERLTYFVLFPALLVANLGHQTLTGIPWESMLEVIVVTLLTSAFVLFVFFKLGWIKDAPGFTSVFQGGVRFNSYISLAVAQGLYGAQGLALATVAAGFMIVLINLLCVTAFVIWGNNTAKGLRAFVKEIMVNPLILGCVVGWGLSLSGIGLPGVTQDVLNIIGRAALPFGLLAVGAALRPRSVHGHAGAIVLSCLVQFGLKPLLVTGLCLWTGLGGLFAPVILIGFMTPTASSSYILARQLGGDTESMASIITFQTLIAFALMPVLSNLLEVF